MIMFCLQSISRWLVIVCLLFEIPGFAQFGDLGDLDIPQKGKVKGITSFRTNNGLFLAVWYAMPSEKVTSATRYSLYIFERSQDQYKEVFRLDAEGDATWEQLMSFDSPRVPGVILFSASGTSSRGPATVIGLVESNFRIIYQGDESEFVDLNADGMPEILESVWPDGDGYPKTTTIHVWNGKIYKSLMKVKWAARFGPVVRDAVGKAFRKGLIR